MALKALLLKKKIDEKRKALDEVNAKLEAFTTREAELEKAINEASELEEGDAKAEAQATVEKEVDAFESEKKEAEEAKANLEGEVADLESELDKEEAEQNTDVPAEAPQEEQRKDTKQMETREMKGLSVDLIQRSEVKAWLDDVRESVKNKRALQNVGLTIPEVLLGVLRENIIEYSKLYKHVTVRRVGGEARQIVMGTIPEAIWTECCANLNELSLGFNDVTIDCHKVGGFYAVCNANLEDSDIDLAREILIALGQSIGYALDKAIDYGKVSGMPLGFVTRLVQEEAPAGYPATARPWVDLHETNVITIPAGTTGVDLFKAILVASGNAKGKYARGAKVWQMNETTYTKLMAEALTINASGALVSGVNGTMPVVGGLIEVLDFIPNNVILGGFMELYLLGERAGNKFATSEHVRFLADQTVYKGTARYDGTPVIAEAFVAIGLEGVTPDADITFASDEANQGA